MNVIDNKEENLKKASTMIAQSVEGYADFIVLPEMFNCPYANEKFIEYAEEDPCNEIIIVTFNDAIRDVYSQKATAVGKQSLIDFVKKYKYKKSEIK